MDVNGISFDFEPEEAPPAAPFLKWAGGKRELIPTIAPLLPPRIRTYYEPFIGGGAVFWHFANTQRFETAVLNDFNPEIVNCYEVIRDEPQALLDQVRQWPVTEELYNELRAQSPGALPKVTRAARTIFLNKAGFNGLYRQNRKGQFNVPWGKRTNVTIVDPDRVLACSRALTGVTLRVGDFAAAVEGAGPGDAVYLDPPYVPLNPTSNFKSYTGAGFSDEDQARVAETCRGLRARGVAVLASNSDTPLVRSLYADFDLIVVPVRRAINSKATHRGPVNELLIVGR